MAKILIVEDDTSLGDNLKRWLASENHVVYLIEDGREALEHIKFYQYDVIVLDWTLPDVSGLEILKAYRAGGGIARVIMLTGRSRIEEKEIGLDSGADDYLTKPFHPKELSARLRALIRRPTPVAEEQLVCGDLTLLVHNRMLLKGEDEISLLPSEFALLEFLMKHQDQVFTPEALLNRIWPTESEVSPQSVRTYMSRLRKKIDTEGQPSLIQNVHGVGYRMASRKG